MQKLIFNGPESVNKDVRISSNFKHRTETDDVYSLTVTTFPLRPGGGRLLCGPGHCLEVAGDLGGGAGRLQADQVN